MHHRYTPRYRFRGRILYTDKTKSSPIPKTPIVIPVEEAKEGEPYCVVCHANKPDCALIPCLHQNYCGECCPKLTECSICRAAITSYGKVYT